MKPKRSFETSGADLPLTFPSRDEIERHVTRSRQLRAEATAAMLASAGRALARPLRRLAAPLIRWRRQQLTHDSLMRAGGRHRIAREDLPLIVGRKAREAGARPVARTIRSHRPANGVTRVTVGRRRSCE